jgi:hypothetical protein
VASQSYEVLQQYEHYKRGLGCHLDFIVHLLSFPECSLHMHRTSWSHLACCPPLPCRPARRPPSKRPPICQLH